MKPSISKQVSSENMSWLFFSRGYLESARRNVKEIQSFLRTHRIKLAKTSLDVGKRRHNNYIYYLSRYRDLWFPTVFMIRHALELILKSFSKKIYNDFFKNHSLDELFSYVNDGVTKDFIEEDVRELQRLSEKYLNYKFDGKNLIQHDKYKDENNILFRYPENYHNAEFIKLDFTYFNEITISKVNEILKDIHNLDTILYSMNIPDHVKHLREIGVPAEESKNKMRENRKRAGSYIKN